MKKSYHSREVPTRLATMTRRTDEAWAVLAVGGIEISLVAVPRSEQPQHRPDRVPAQQQGSTATGPRGGMLSGSATATRRLLATACRPSARRCRAAVDILIAVRTRARSAHRAGRAARVRLTGVSRERQEGLRSPDSTTPGLRTCRNTGVRR